MSGKLEETSMSLEQLFAASLLSLSLPTTGDFPPSDASLASSTREQAFFGKLLPLLLQ